MHLPGCQKSGAFHIRIKKNRVSHILFVEKKGLIIYLAALKKGAIWHVYPYYAIYRNPPGPTSCKLSYNIFHSFNPVLLVKNIFVRVLAENDFERIK